MTFRVRLTDEAKSELRANAIWWAKHRSEEQAIQWLDGFHSALQKLEIDPERYPLAQEAARLNRQLRQLNYGLKNKKTHRALFEIHGVEVFVQTIRHLAQDDWK